MKKTLNYIALHSDDECQMKSLRNHTLSVVTNSLIYLFLDLHLTWCLYKTILFVNFVLNVMF